MNSHNLLRSRWWRRRVRQWNEGVCCENLDAPVLFHFSFGQRMARSWTVLRETTSGAHGSEIDRGGDELPARESHYFVQHDVANRIGSLFTDLLLELGSLPRGFTERDVGVANHHERDDG